MAHFDATTAHSLDAGRHGIGHYLTAPFRFVWTTLVSIAESNARIREVERLQSMSDTELARRGIKREDIIREVFLKHGYY